MKPSLYQILDWFFILIKQNTIPVQHWGWSKNVIVEGWMKFYFLDPVDEEELEGAGQEVVRVKWMDESWV